MKERIDFARNAEAALRNPFLQSALRTAMVRFRSLRDAVVEEVPEWQVLREYAYATKMHVLANLDRYLTRLEANVAAAGGVVHWVRSGDEAASTIVDLARRHKAQTIVKSKSMTTEEIELNRFLHAAGVQVAETDLGEYLIQLAGERPAHFVVPAVHKSKGSIAALLSEKLGIPRFDDAAQLTRAVRGELRQRFFAADMGVSGVNFAIADTGTIVIVENEGNARLTTTLPRVHVALMGIEKVIPRLADLAVFLTLLPRSATGQRMTGYVSFITGPRRAGEVDGPEEFHLIIMDNGRSSIHADRAMRECLACIRCGACLNSCPVFERTGGHAYGSVYSGPIGAVLTPLYRGLDVGRDLPFASSLCGACEEVCPVKIGLPRLLLELRSRIVRRRGASWMDRLFVRGWVATMMNPTRLRAAGRVVRILHHLALRQRVPLPYPFSEWSKARDLPPPAGPPFRDRWRS